MINLENELRQQLEEMTSLVAGLDKKLKQYKNVEEGKLRVTVSHGCPQYRFTKAGDDKDKEYYIPSYEKDKIRLLAQREYDVKVRDKLELARRRLDKYLRMSDENRIEDVFNDLCDGRKRLVEPAIPTKEMMIEEWLRNHPGNLNRYERTHEFPTMRGEIVRSKSEKLIADYLFHEGIPYVCEPCYTLFDGRVVYPDFAALNVRKNKTIYWEHLGKAGEIDYATRNFSKLMDYEQSGMVIGENFIVTLETKERPLDIKLVKEKVKNLLL